MLRPFARVVLPARRCRLRAVDQYDRRRVRRTAGNHMRGAMARLHGDAPMSSRPMRQRSLVSRANRAGVAWRPEDRAHVPLCCSSASTDDISAAVSAGVAATMILTRLAAGSNVTSIRTGSTYDVRPDAIACSDRDRYWCSDCGASGMSTMLVTRTARGTGAAGFVCANAARSASRMRYARPTRAACSLPSRMKRRTVLGGGAGGRRILRRYGT